MQWCPSLWTLPGSKQMSFDSFSSTFPASVHEAPVMPYQTIIQTCLTKTCPEISEKLKQITLWENIRQRKWNPENCWCLKETHLLAWSTPICRLQCLQKITQIFCCTAPCWFPAGFPGGLPLLQMIDCNHLIYCSTATWKMPIDIYWIFYRYPFISTRPIPVKLFQESPQVWISKDRRCCPNGYVGLWGFAMKGKVACSECEEGADFKQIC